MKRSLVTDELHQKGKLIVLDPPTLADPLDCPTGVAALAFVPVGSNLPDSPAAKAVWELLGKAQRVTLLLGRTSARTADQAATIALTCECLVVILEVSGEASDLWLAALADRCQALPGLWVVPEHFTRH